MFLWKFQRQKQCDWRYVPNATWWSWTPLGIMLFVWDTPKERDLYSYTFLLLPIKVRLYSNTSSCPKQKCPGAINRIATSSFDLNKPRKKQLFTDDCTPYLILELRCCNIFPWRIFRVQSLPNFSDGYIYILLIEF